MLLLLAWLALHAQDVPIKPLKVGDSVPDITFRMLNYSMPDARLSDFKGKLLILDFWATHCAPCIAAFPKLQSLQEKFKDSVQVILLNEQTGDTEAKVNAFFKNRERTGRAVSLPSSIGGNTASTLFPHTTIPHCVVLKDGKVLAITGSESITAVAIRDYLRGRGANMAQKTDYFADRMLVLNSGSVIDDAASQMLFRKGYLPGLSSGERTRRLNDLVRGLSFRNISISQMYFNVLRNLRPDIWDMNRVLFVDTAVKLKMDSVATYELVVSPLDKESVYSYAMNDLNRYSGYNCTIEKRKIACYVLKAAKEGIKARAAMPGADPEMKAGGNGMLHYKNGNVKQLINRITGKAAFIKVPVIDETGYSGEIDYELPVEIKDMASLQHLLNKMGFGLSAAERELEVFVLSAADED